MSHSSTNPGKQKSLKYYLQTHKTIPEKSFTHTALGEPPKSYPGSYCIEDGDLEEFFKVYTNTTFKQAEQTPDPARISPEMLQPEGPPSALCFVRPLQSHLYSQFGNKNCPIIRNAKSF